ncbi:MAG TPA: DUF5995 family protein [Bacteroidota bacterium]|nr:DUF5995 family protein [Bacteroidota bacterium]
MEDNNDVVTMMSETLRSWRESGDRRAVFLGCYSMMTRNMLRSIDAGEFRDAAWVRTLLQRFAEYYFAALADYERRGAGLAPAWRIAHDAASAGEVSALQLLLLGVNAHINYDLVLTLEELLRPEWAQLSDNIRKSRHADYCLVNEVIARTIDAVQDEVLEEAMPSMAVVDVVLGRMDEHVTSTLLTRWRDEVWDDALRLLHAGDEQARRTLCEQVDRRTQRRAAWLGVHDPRSAITALRALREEDFTME